MEASLAFYQSAASLTRGEHDRICGGLPIEPEQTATLESPNGYLQLMQFASAESDPAVAIPVEGPGVTHVCFQSPADDHLFNKFIGLNASTVSTGEPPIDLGGYGVRYGYARDADNIMFEVEQLDKPPFKGPIWIAHVALVSHDIDRSVAFYQSLFGIEPYRRINRMRGQRAEEVTGLKDVGARAAWFNTGNMIVEIWQYTNPVTPEPGSPVAFDQVGYNKYAFEVFDLDAECKKLSDAGVEISEKMTSNEVTEVYARDPDGNLFSLLQTTDSNATSVRDVKKIDWLPSPAAPDVTPPG